MLVAVSTLAGLVDRAALGQFGGRPDLSSGGARGGGVLRASARPLSPASRRRSPIISSSPSRSTRSESPPADVVTVVVLFIVALVTSQLAAGSASRRGSPHAHAARNATIAGLRPAAAVVHAASRRSRDVACAELGRAVRLQRDAGQRLARAAHRRRARRRQSPHSERHCRGRADARDRRAAGRGLTARQPAEWQFHPVRSDGRCSPRSALPATMARRRSTDDQLPLLGSLLDQIALALERARLEARGARVRRAARTRPDPLGPAVVDRPGPEAAARSDQRRASAS